MLPLHCVLCSPRSTPDRSVTLQGAPLTPSGAPAAMCAIVTNVSTTPPQIGTAAMTTTARETATAADTDQRANILPYCDACEDDHPSRVTADGAVICAREGEDR